LGALACEYLFTILAYGACFESVCSVVSC